MFKKKTDDSQMFVVVYFYNVYSSAAWDAFVCENYFFIFRNDFFLVGK